MIHNAFIGGSKEKNSVVMNLLEEVQVEYYKTNEAETRQLDSSKNYLIVAYYNSGNTGSSNINAVKVITFISGVVNELHNVYDYNTQYNAISLATDGTLTMTGGYDTSTPQHVYIYGKDDGYTERNTSSGTGTGNEIETVDIEDINSGSVTSYSFYTGETWGDLISRLNDGVLTEDSGYVYLDNNTVWDETNNSAAVEPSDTIYSSHVYIIENMIN